MLILGWHGNPRPLEEEHESAGVTYHDASAVLLRDGAIVAAIEEERLSREKHTRSFPAGAIGFCLARARATLHDVEAIVTDTAENVADLVADREAARDPGTPFSSGRAMIARAFAREFHVDVTEKLHFCRHHIAHLYAACYPSGFSDALAVCLDGNGDGASGLIARFSTGDFQVLRYLPEAHSLGSFYEQQLFFLGYRVFDEYKAMGLAPYGDPTVYTPYFERLYTLQPKGRFQILPLENRLMLMREAGLTANARRKGQPFTQAHKDFAAALQATLERVVHHLVRHFHQQTGARRLCISGGVGHNCTLNGRLLRSGLFEKIFVQPAAHDAGNALGAALSIAHQARERVRGDLLTHVFLGTDVGAADEIERRLQAWGPLLNFEKVSDPSDSGARLIADGAVIAWVQGRSEFGPRALGNRSILADPRPAQNKQIINAMIKKREAYRPFAPAVLEEALHEYFEVPEGTCAVPFMVFVLPVRPQMRELLGAVTHVDGSARVQSVRQEQNPQFYSLIDRFRRLTGVPVVLNTSFNNNAEPIVDSVDDAVVTFLTTGLDWLIVGDWLVSRAPHETLTRNLPGLTPRLARGRGLTRRTAGTAGFYIDGPIGRYPPAPLTPISHEVFRVLLEDNTESIQARCDRLGYERTPRERVCSELFELWTGRNIDLVPRRHDCAAQHTAPMFDIAPSVPSIKSDQILPAASRER
jgi:carbamoyltransferase